MTRRPAPSDAFDAHYGAGLLAAPQVDPREREREEREGQARAAPGEPFALRGCVLTPDEAVPDGWVVVAGSTIAEIRSDPPDSVPVLETGGVILPGLIDLHGHPEYNVFAMWEPPRQYENRYQWRSSAEYQAVVKDPWQRLTTADGDAPSLGPVLARYAEARALVGGTTAIQGASGRYPDPHESLVRNVDRYIFGAHPGRSAVDLPFRPEELQSLRDGIASGKVRAFYVHLAEGVDQRSRAELDTLADDGLLGPATVIIHGTALDETGLRRVKDAGAKLVWSPQSNLRLYGTTSNAATALALGIPMALGADWLPSGSPSLLDEAHVARRVLAAQGAPIPSQRLVQMLTSEAAAIAGLGDRLGRIEAGRPADLVVLERLSEDPWESVTRSDRRAVELVTIGGDVAYGRVPWVEQLAGPTEREEVHAWGKMMAVDLTYSVMASEGPPPRLSELRTQLLARYPQTGPIFA